RPGFSTMSTSAISTDFASRPVSVRRPRRLCPKCATDEEITQSSPLWPDGWRCSACGFAHSARDGFVQLAPDLDDGDEGCALESYVGLRAIEDGHFWFTTRNEMITWLVQRFAAHAGRVMEIGCGTGFVLFALRKALPSAYLSGSELHSQGLSFARQRH